MMATGKKVVQVYIFYKTTATIVRRLSYQNIDNACSLFLLPITTRLYTGRGTNHNKHVCAHTRTDARTHAHTHTHTHTHTQHAALQIILAPVVLVLCNLYRISRNERSTETLKVRILVICDCMLLLILTFKVSVDRSFLDMR